MRGFQLSRFTATFQRLTWDAGSPGIQPLLALERVHSRSGKRP